MKLTRYKLGDLIVQRREKNEGFDVPIRGVSREGFIKPKQQDADTSIYNVFYRNDFVFNPARMELNSIALNLEFDKALCSSLYEVFYVKDQSIVLPEFLNLHIKRDEFARHCEYIGSGSAREYCRVAQISEFDIDLPSIEVQQKVVDANRLLAKRIDTNKKLIATLEQTAQTLYRHTFIDNIDPNNLPEGWRMGTVADLVTTQYGYTEIATEEKVGPKFLRITDIVGSQIDWNSVPHCPITESEYKKYQLKEGDIVVSRTGANIGYAKQIRGEIPEAVYASFLVRLKPNDGIYNWYLGLSVDSQEYKDFIFANQQGSAQPQANANVMGQYPIAIPDEKTLKTFNSVIYPILRKISLHQLEISKLNEMKPLLLSKMGRI